MRDDFIYSQYKKIRGLIESHKNCKVFKEFEIEHLIHEEDFDLMTEELAEQIPVFDHKSYMEHIRRVVRLWDVPDATILAGKNIIHPQKPDAQALWQGEPYPVSNETLKQIARIQEEILSGKHTGAEKVKGKVFQVFDEFSQDDVHGIPQAHLLALLQKHRSFSMRKRFVPQIDEMQQVGKSRFQVIHAFLELLEKHGKEIEVLYCRPQMLCEMSQVLAQREGRNIVLKELCPNLKMLMHYGENILPHRQEIQKFLTGLSVQYYEVKIHPTGLVALQNSTRDKGLFKLLDDTGVFYSFVPEASIHSNGFPERRHDRLHVGQLKIGKRYLLLTSSPNGFLMYNTGFVIEVASVDPLTVRFIRQATFLNYFDENLTSDVTDSIVAKVNDQESSYGFLIRDYLFADDVYSEQMHMIFEVNRPITSIPKQTLQNLVNTIHTELIFKSKAYKDVMTMSKVSLPEMTFVSSGSFSTSLPNGLEDHLDASDEALEAKTILSQAGEKITLVPESNA